MSSYSNSGLGDNNGLDNLTKVPPTPAPTIDCEPIFGAKYCGVDLVILTVLFGLFVGSIACVLTCLFEGCRLAETRCNRSRQPRMNILQAYPNSKVDTATQALQEPLYRDPEAEQDDNESVDPPALSQPLLNGTQRQSRVQKRMMTTRYYRTRQMHREMGVARCGMPLTCSELLPTVSLMG